MVSTKEAKLQNLSFEKNHILYFDALLLLALSILGFYYAFAGVVSLNKNLYGIALAIFLAGFLLSILLFKRKITLLVEVLRVLLSFTIADFMLYFYLQLSKWFGISGCTSCNKSTRPVFPEAETGELLLDNVSLLVLLLFITANITAVYFIIKLLKMQKTHFVFFAVFVILVFFIWFFVIGGTQIQGFLGMGFFELDPLLLNFFPVFYAFMVVLGVDVSRFMRLLNTKNL